MFHNLYHHLGCIPRRYLMSWLNTFLKFQARKVLEILPEYLNFHANNSEDYYVPFTMQEPRHALQHTKNSSPGEDTIFAEMLKKLKSNAQETLLKIYNGIWEADVLPPSWKTSVIVSIAKPGKDPKLRTSYRPIALTSVLCKIFKRMVNFRLIYHMESHALRFSLSVWVPGESFDSGSITETYYIYTKWFSSK